MRVKHPLTATFLLSILLIGLAFVRMELIAGQAAEDACDAFHQSQDLLKNILILAVPTEISTSEGATTKERQEAAIELERRLAFRNRLIQEVEKAEC